jgi:hypothetical protein
MCLGLLRPLRQGSETVSGVAFSLKNHALRSFFQLEYRLHDQTGGFSPPVFFGSFFFNVDISHLCGIAANCSGNRDRSGV